MKETLVKDPKGLNRREALPVRETDKVCAVANFSERPLGSKTEVRKLARLWDGVALSVLGRGEVRVSAL